jgi:imidazolonepropionase
VAPEIKEELSSHMWDDLWIGASLATMQGKGLGEVEAGAVAVQDGKIAWVGSQNDLPQDLASKAKAIHQLGGGWILPGFIDCHTHLVFAGDRAREFEMRLEGATYEEIARAGGGILSTVQACRAASEEELVRQSLPRLKSLMSEGVTTVEIKSGYGLDVETEIRMLRAARAVGQGQPIDIKTTFLGAHAIPPEFDGKADDYIEEVCTRMLPAIAKEGLADAVDGFCEGIAFSREQIARVFAVARDLGLPVKLHADQLSDLGGASLAAEFSALSADHLEYMAPESAMQMAASDTVAVLLPGAFYFLGEDKLPPIDALRSAGADMALATDCNPGSSPISSLRLILNMGCTLFGLTPTECLRGVTTNAAKALGMSKDRGKLEPGMKADFAHWPIHRPTDLCYWLSGDRPDIVVKSGRVV